MRHAQTLNEAQFRKVLQYCRTRRHVNRDTTILMVSFYAGLRAKEIAALRLGDVFNDWGMYLTQTAQYARSLRLSALIPRVGNDAQST